MSKTAVEEANETVGQGSYRAVVRGGSPSLVIERTRGGTDVSVREGPQVAGVGQAPAAGGPSQYRPVLMGAGMSPAS